MYIKDETHNRDIMRDMANEIKQKLKGITIAWLLSIAIIPDPLSTI